MNRLWYPFRFKLKLCGALLVAAVASALTPRASAKKVLAAFKLWFEWSRHRESAPFWVYVHRLHTCYHCPIFYRPLATCGSPLRKELRGLGCYCNMQAKSNIINATCWLRDIGDSERGWGDNLTRLSRISDDAPADGSNPSQPTAIQSAKPCRCGNGRATDGGSGRDAAPDGIEPQKHAENSREQQTSAIS